MFILLFLLWILLNGKITLELTVFGLIIAGLIYLFACLFMNFSFKKDWYFIRILPLIVWYLLTLVIEVVKSNLNILFLILNKKKTPDPEIVHFTIELESEFLRVIFANSITLTPGTITVSLDHKKYTVHALRSEYIDGIENARLLKILKKMEEKKK